jgi:transcriptional regulator with XRE-family HTH domain
MLNHFVLASLRKLTGLTRDAVADLTGLSARTIRELETNPDSNPTLGTLFRLCRLYSITPDLLIHYDGPVGPNIDTAKVLIARSHLAEHIVPRGTSAQ